MSATGVGGDSLRGIDGRRISQPYVLADIVSGKTHTVARLSAAGQMGGGETAVVMDGGDRPQVAVAHPVAFTKAQSRIVAAGTDEVTDRGHQAIAKHHSSALRGAGACESIGAGTRVEFGHHCVGRGQHDGVAAHEVITGPRDERVIVDRAFVSAMDTAVIQIPAQRGRIPVA